LTVKETPNPIELAFSGIHIVKKELLNFIPSTEKKSLTPLYLELAENQSILGYLHQKDSWMDVGRYEDYLKIGKQH
jgi:NDP-sugar pyrophosphorylase family protein